MLSTESIDLLLGTDGDLVLGDDFDLQFSSGVAGVGQSVTINILSARGELFCNQEIYPPWFEGLGVTSDQAILGGKFDPRKVAPQIAADIVAAPGVRSIRANTASYDGATRTLGVNFSVFCDFDDLEDQTIADGAVDRLF